MRIVVVLVLAGCGAADPPPATPVSSAPATPANIALADAGSASDSDDAGSRGAYVMASPDVGTDDNTGTSGHASGSGTGTGMRARGPGPNIKLDPADVGAGGLDPAIVRRYLKRNIMKLQYCYERVLEHKPGLAGTVIATFTIGADGHVRKADASGVDPDVASCMIGVIKDLEFPKATNDFDVRYPIEVHPT